MKGRQLSLIKSLRALSNKRDCKINPSGVIYMLTGAKKPLENDLGNKSWGHIDYLRKVHKFTLSYVDQF